MESTRRVDANRVLVRQIYVDIGRDIIIQSSTYFLRFGGTENNPRKILYIWIDSDRKYGDIVRRVVIIFSTVYCYLTTDNFFRITNSKDQSN